MLIFPLSSIPQKYPINKIERGIGNYLISKKVPIIDFYSHNYQNDTTHNYQNNTSYNIRFKNLPKLLNSMKEKEYIIDSFPFYYNKVKYIVILKPFMETERKPSKYAVAKLEFILSTDTSQSIHAYADFYEVKFNSCKEFTDFFNVKNENKLDFRGLFVEFAEIFSNYIPSEKIINKKDAQISKLQGVEQREIIRMQYIVMMLEEMEILMENPINEVLKTVIKLNL